MILRQFLHADPVAASSLVGCGGKASAAVVDPLGDVAPYLRAAEATGMRIRYVVDTHLHADHLSAGRRLADEAGAEYVLFAKANATFPFRGVRDGDVLELGNVSIKVLHTPGHTPEHISLLVTDHTRSDEPWFVLTGHTLMVGDLGRTQLRPAQRMALAPSLRAFKSSKHCRTIWKSCPSCFPGSGCGRSLSGKPTSTIGLERAITRPSGSRTKLISWAP